MSIAVTRNSQFLLGLRVLVVDDDADVRDALLSILRCFGADGTAVECAPEARALLAAQRFDVLLSDIDMPHEDGLALIRSVRRGHRTRDLAAAAVTAGVTTAQCRAAIAAGFDRVLPKPPDVEALVAVVRELAQR